MFEYDGQKIENKSFKEMIDVSKNIDRTRSGKTQKDHKNGNLSRNATNKQVRDTWIQETRGLRIGSKPFPDSASKGKGNSSKARKY